MITHDGIRFETRGGMGCDFVVTGIKGGRFHAVSVSEREYRADPGVATQHAMEAVGAAFRFESLRFDIGEEVVYSHATECPTPRYGVVSAVMTGDATKLRPLVYVVRPEYARDYLRPAPDVVPEDIAVPDGDGWVIRPAGDWR